MTDTTTATTTIQQGRADHLPAVSIGLPVYNGGKYLREVLDSLLAQTFTDFELIVSDNVSIDETQGICEEYALRDKRIKYVRQKKWLTALDNFYYCLAQAQGNFFMWAAADDYHPPNFIEVLADCLDKKPSAILAFGKTQVVKNDSPVSDAVEVPFAFSTEGKAAWAALTITSQVLCYHIYGLWKTKALRTIPYDLYGRYSWAADVAMLMSASVLGEFVCCRETAFVYREIKKTAKKRAKDIDGRNKHNQISASIGFMRAAFLSVYKTGGALLAMYAVWLVAARHLRVLLERTRNHIGKSTS